MWWYSVSTLHMPLKAPFVWSMYDIFQCYGPWGFSTQKKRCITNLHFPISIWIYRDRYGNSCLWMILLLLGYNSGCAWSYSVCGLQALAFHNNKACSKHLVLRFPLTSCMLLLVVIWLHECRILSFDLHHKSFALEVLFPHFDRSLWAFPPFRKAFLTVPCELYKHCKVDSGRTDCYILHIWRWCFIQIFPEVFPVVIEAWFLDSFLYSHMRKSKVPDLKAECTSTW